MIASTEEFLTLLRAGNYIRAMLGWNEFLIDKYTPTHKKEPVSGTDLFYLILFELINHGFVTEDMRHIQLIYAAVEEMPEFSAEDVYTICLMSDAALWFQIYEKKNVLEKYKLIQPDKEKITLLMTQSLPELGKKQCIPLFERRRDSWDANRGKLSNEVRELKAGRKKMEALLDLVNAYAQRLKAKAPLREGVLESLRQFLLYALDCEQSREKIDNFVEQIRQDLPEDWEEEEYLGKISPLPLYRRLLGYGQLAWGFFSQPALAAPETPSQQISP